MFSEFARRNELFMQRLGISIGYYFNLFMICCLIHFLTFYVSFVLFMALNSSLPIYILTGLYMVIMVCLYPLTIIGPILIYNNPNQRQAYPFIIQALKLSPRLAIVTLCYLGLLVILNILAISLTESLSLPLLKAYSDAVAFYS